jgi:hypothetical protein
MIGLPKDRWLKEQGLKIRWAPHGIAKALHLDNAAEFHSVALKRGCEPVWTESEELRRFVTGYLAMLPVRKDPSGIGQRFIEYLLALTDGVTG